MFEKSEIMSAIEIAKENHLDNKILNMFDKRAILRIVNNRRWKHGASKFYGGFMTEKKFKRIIRNRKFFCTIDKIGMKG